MTDHDQDVTGSGFRHKPTLDGELVLLRPVTADDVPALLPLFQDAPTMRFTGSHDTDRPDEARLRAWYGSRAEQDDRLDLAVVEKATGRVVGEVVLNEWDPGNESCNFRTVFVPGAQGRGLGTEATRLILAHGFERLGLHRVSLEVYAFNPRARRVYEKVGFVPEGVLRDALLWEGERVDAVVMSLLAPEWSEHRGRPRLRAGREPSRNGAPAIHLPAQAPPRGVG
ncbi:GNAT family N-acetyltransferase [Streptomyces sp. NPDC015220]|uniref:GNAT family N-acetyltransferase n=1 Tax=Streptomyces sp. NPDC015220 TaxID=3364947 RepID=UPI0037013A6E